MRDNRTSEDHDCSTNVFTTSEAAQYLNVSKQSVLSAVYRSRLNAIRKTKETYLFARAELDRYRATARPGNPNWTSKPRTSQSKTEAKPT